MKQSVLIFGLLAFFILFSMSGCSHERTYFHNKNGKVRSVRAHKTPPWFYYTERGYNKKARNVIRRWDRNFR